MPSEQKDLTYAEGLAASLPVRDDDSESDLISLVDIVITGIETPWSGLHFQVKDYDFEASGETLREAWAEIVGLPSAYTEEQLKSGNEPGRVTLFHETVRSGVVRYLQDRLNRGMAPSDVAKMIDGSYTDAVVADSILQFCLYGEEVFA